MIISAAERVSVTPHGMSLLRWLREERWRGSIGTFDWKPPAPHPGPPSRILVRGAIAVTLLAILAYLFLDSVATTESPVITASVIFAYGILAFWTDARPARDNMGAWGGLFDQPFRASDDYNRVLAVTALLVWPGRFVTSAIRDVIVLYARAASDG
jgi:hypothetical protein